jgi:carbonic anhydrase
MSTQVNPGMTGMDGTRRRTHRTVVTLALLALAVGSAAAEAEFAYFGSAGPTFWGRLDPAWEACGSGREQSPVDFGKHALLTALHRKPVPVDYERSTGQIFNNGHTIEIETEGRNVLLLDGVEYELQQFHFHVSSEHTFAGDGADMELHLVHKSAAGDTAVVGVLLQRGASSGALAPIFAQLPDDVEVHHPLAAPFNPARFLPVDRAQYRYEGSLTTPPCTEGVHWLVLKDPITVSSEDLAQFHERIHFNARPVQRFFR